MRIDMYKRIDYRCSRCGRKTYGLINTLRVEIELCVSCYELKRGVYIAEAFGPIKEAEA